MWDKTGVWNGKDTATQTVGFNNLPDFEVKPPASEIEGCTLDAATYGLSLFRVHSCMISSAGAFLS